MWTPRKSKPRSDPNLNLNLDTKDPNLDTQKTETALAGRPRM